MPYLPDLVVHADWGSFKKKRWMSSAVLQSDRQYIAFQPELVGDLNTFLERIKLKAGPYGSVLLGFDFPIGLPIRYAEHAGIDDFFKMLLEFGSGIWADFYNVAKYPEEISFRRPFYPHQSKKGSEQKHLIDALGVDTFDDMRRQCELAQIERRAASPLFWTLGGQQVGKAAIIGWRDVLGPALQAKSLDIKIWPFDGCLSHLVKSNRIVVVETYPAEYYGHLGASFPPSKAGNRSGKRVQVDRVTNAPALMRWAKYSNIQLSNSLKEAIYCGFGVDQFGEDRFDAIVGLFGMLNVVTGRRDEGMPEDERIRKIEGWILGQS